MEDDVRMRLARAYEALHESPAALRGFAALLGAITADAAAAPCHWVYDKQKLAGIVGSADAAFFKGKPNPFYNIPIGANTCYGDQLTTIISCMSQNSGELDRMKAADRFYERFVLSQDYASSVAAKRDYAYNHDQQARTVPINGPWRHGTLDAFARNYEACGAAYKAEANDASVDALIRALPPAVVAGVAGIDPDPAVKVAVELTQTNATALAHAKAFARALAAVVQGTYSPSEALAAEAAHLESLLAARATARDPLTFVNAIDALGQRLTPYAHAPPQKIIA